MGVQLRHPDGVIGRGAGAMAGAICLGLSAAPAAGAAAAPSPIPAPAGGPAGQIGLSDERTTTRWAEPVAQVIVRRWPSARSPAIGPLADSAPDGSTEVYVVRSQWLDPRGMTWLRIRLPGRPGPSEGWVTRGALGRLGVSHTAIRVNRRLLTLVAYRKGRPVLRAPIGIGKPGTPTPAGRFWIRARYRLRPGSVYGPVAMTTTATSPTLTDWPGGAIVALHGTLQPWLVPGRPSHGCVRLHDRDAIRLYRLATPGTPVAIV